MVFQLIIILERYVILLPIRSNNKPVFLHIVFIWPQILLMSERKWHPKARSQGSVRSDHKLSSLAWISYKFSYCSHFECGRPNSRPKLCLMVLKIFFKITTIDYCHWKNYVLGSSKCSSKSQPMTIMSAKWHWTALYPCFRFQIKKKLFLNL